MSTPTEELRAAATRLHGSSGLTTRVDSDSREMLEMIRILLDAREPLVKWLKDTAVIHLPDSECGYCIGQRNPLMLPCPALAVARAINTSADPGPGRANHITDRRSGAFLCEGIKRAAGES